MPTPDNTDQNPPAPPQDEMSFEEWLAAKEDADIGKGLFEKHTAGLKTALNAERESNKKFQAQLRELARKAEKGSELEAELVKQADALKGAERRAHFMDSAHTAKVRNLQLAYLAAESAGLVSETGDCDFSKLKVQFPELFSVVSSANAGDGAGGDPPQKADMNVTLRKAFGL